jgi:hypothetical protein
MTTRWTPTADAVLTTHAALGQTAWAISRAIADATGWAPGRDAIRARAQKLGVQLRGAGRPRLPEGRPEPVRLGLRLTVDTAAALAEAAAAAGIHPSALAAEVIETWARGAQEPTP